MKNTSLDSEVFTTCKGEQTKTYQNFTPAKVEKLLFLPPNLNRQGEGGVRIKEYGKDFNGAAQTSVSEENLKTRNLTQPLVTIITVVFNSEKYLEPTIQSVLEQTYSNVEYIVIDGGSTDGTLDIIRKYDKVIDYWVSEPDLGIYDAMNKGIMVSSGQLIGILNSGDVYIDSAVEEVTKVYRNAERDRPLIISGAMYRFNEQRNIEFKLGKCQGDLKARINRGMPINHPATFVSRSVYEIFGAFNPNYKVCGDYDFIFRAYHSKNVEFIFTNKALARMMLGGTSEKFRNLWTRCVEHFSIRRNKVFWLKNIMIGVYWLTIAVTKHSIRKILGSSVMSRYYHLRHGK